MLPPYLCAKFQDWYDIKAIQILYCSGFQRYFYLFFILVFGQGRVKIKPKQESKRKRRVLMPTKSFSATFSMLTNSIFFLLESGGKEHPVTIPLPVILYSPQKGFSLFMSSRFHHGHEGIKDTHCLPRKKLKNGALIQRNFVQGRSLL